MKHLNTPIATPNCLISRKVLRFSFLIILPLVLSASFIVSSSARRNEEGLRGVSSDGTNLGAMNVTESQVKPVAGDLQRLLNFGNGLERVYGPLVPQATAETIDTFQQNCTTQNSSFTTGDTVCAHAGGTLFGERRIYWVNPDKNVVQVDTVSSSSRNASRVVSQVGTWRVYLVDASDGSARAVAAFSVRDPQQPAVDLTVVKGSGDGTYTAGGFARYTVAVTNNGPDTANSVSLSESTPNNTTFTGFTPEDAGAATFTCTPGSPTVCTAASLAAGVSATFTFVYTVAPGTPVGTVIENTASVTSSTTELNPRDNTTTIAGTVTGSGGGTNTCSVACPDDISTPANTHQDPNDPNSTPGAVVHFSPPSGNDECGVITVSHCNNCFFPQGTTVVTATATTGESCSFTVKVTPPSGTAPTISCPANQSANAPQSSCSVNFSVGTATATGGTNVTIYGQRSDGEAMYTCDDFGNCTRNNTDAPFTYGVTTITWTASSHDIPGPYNDQTGDEDSHRTGSTSCTQTITVNDVTPPTISAANGSTSADANCQAPVPDYSNTVSDNCSAGISYTQTPAAGTLVGAGAHTVHIEANDNSSNNNGTGNTATKDVTFTVNDTTPPTITCPANISLPNTPGTCNASVSPGVATATDSCDGTIVPTASRSDGKPLTDPFPVGSTTIHWTATDSAGNSASCDQTVVILDNENPTITCPANITTNTEPGACSATVNPGTATATDNCGDGNPPTVTGTRSDNQPLNAPYPKGTTTIHWTATDSAGNSASCNQTVTVNDNEAPAISCPANITRSTDSGVCAANINPGMATATDNCDNPTVTGTRSDGQPLNAPYPKGTTTITWTATDSSGNQSSCTQTITVNDTEPPAITCPANIIASTEPGTCAAHVAPGTATATDNCGTATVSGTRSDGRPLTDTYPRGTTTITWTATDGSGNQSSCSQTITVNDTQAPTITFNGQTPSMWPPNHTYHTFTAANFISSVSDNCDSLSVSDVYITNATSDEAENAGGSGNTLNDIVIAGDCKSIQLRAERINSGNGRVYTIYFKLKDSSGNFTTGTAKVYSPKNEGETPGDDGPHYTVTSSCP